MSDLDSTAATPGGVVPAGDSSDPVEPHAGSLEIGVEPDAAPPSPPAARLVRGSEGKLVRICIDPQAPFDAVRRELERLLGAAPGRFRGALVRLDLRGRDLDLFDLRRWVHLLRDAYHVQVTGIYCLPEHMHRWVERELKLKVWTDAPEDQPSAEPPPASANAPTQATMPLGSGDDASGSTTVVMGAPARDTAATPPTGASAGRADDGPSTEPRQEPGFTVVRRTIRSGTVVRASGDLLVYGDVNAGAQIEAGGDIIVLGALRGAASAGAPSNDGAVVIAFDLRPTRIRIGGHMALAPDEATGLSHVARSWKPEIAWVDGTRIVFEEYRGRLPPRSGGDGARTARSHPPLHGENS